MRTFNIAIDGPAGAGKSSAARMVAKVLGFIYVDTGAMYRAVTWSVLKKGIPPLDAEKVTSLAKELEIELLPGAEGQKVLVNGQDVTSEIRTSEVTSNVSAVSSIPEVREILVRKQKQLATAKGVVMDGRDIGTHVLPDAEVKVFLTASPRQRAERRLQELGDPTMTLDRMEQEIIRRDKLDQEREASPLRQAKDAVLVDSTDMPLDQVVETVLSLCQAKVGGE